MQTTRTHSQNTVYHTPQNPVVHTNLAVIRPRPATATHQPIQRSRGEYHLTGAEGEAGKGDPCVRKADVAEPMRNRRPQGDPPPVQRGRLPAAPTSPDAASSTPDRDRDGRTPRVLIFVEAWSPSLVLCVLVLM
jgi:hypothetical protein